LFAPPKRCECPDHQFEQTDEEGNKTTAGMPVRLCPRSAEEYNSRDWIFPDLDAVYRKETKGLPRDYKDMSIHEPISFGIVPYYGGHLDESGIQSYLAMPSERTLRVMESDPDQFAIKTHGFTRDKLEKSYDGEHLLSATKLPRTADTPAGKTGMSFTTYQPATDMRTAIARTARALGEAVRNGAVIAGANVRGFDIAMLKHHYERLTGEPIETSGFDPRKARYLDVIRHRQLLSGETFRRPLSDATPAVQAISARRGGRKYKDTQSDLYRVQQGDHSAVADARTSVDVAINQILQAQGRFTPNTPRIG